jgi:hypothetical protein
MMERGGDLNHSLKPTAMRLAGGQPDFFPGFVRFEELAAVKLRHPACELFLLG